MSTNRGVKMTTEDINNLPTQQDRAAAWIECALYGEYDAKDALIDLSQAFMRLPACPLLVVIGNAIQEIQYYRNQDIDDLK